MADHAIGGLSYLETVSGLSEPDLAFCNGSFVLEMRRKLGNLNLLDSDGQPIILGWVYMLTPGEVHQYWEDE